LRIAKGVLVSKEVRAVIYARVSSSDQKSDLERQVDYLKQYCVSKRYKVIDVLSDIASGLKADRKDLLKLFSNKVCRKAGLVVVAYRDRPIRSRRASRFLNVDRSPSQLPGSTAPLEHIGIPRSLWRGGALNNHRDTITSLWKQKNIREHQRQSKDRWYCCLHVSMYLDVYSLKA
jgi:hypothetical protein